MARNKDEKNGITVAAANQRLKALAKTFGYESEVYKMASAYIEDRIDEQYIRRDKNNNIKNIIAHQGKEIEKESSFTNKQGTEIKRNYTVVEEGVDLNNAFGRSYTFEQYLPKVMDLFKAVAKDNNVEGTIRGNEAVKKKLIPLANAYAHQVTEYNAAIDELYNVRDDIESVGSYDPETAIRLSEEAKSALDDRERTDTWIALANQLIQEYNDAYEDMVAHEYE